MVERARQNDWPFLYLRHHQFETFLLFVAGAFRGWPLTCVWWTRRRLGLKMRGHDAIWLTRESYVRECRCSDWFVPWRHRFSLSLCCGATKPWHNLVRRPAYLYQKTSSGGRVSSRELWIIGGARTNAFIASGPENGHGSTTERKLVRSDTIEGGTMSATAGLASIIIAAEFLLGSIVGLAVAAAIHRSRLRSSIAIIAMFCAGAVFICASWIAVWADLSTSLVEGHVIAAAPWSICPQLANCIADNRLALCIVSSAVSAAIASLCLRGRVIKATQLEVIRGGPTMTLPPSRHSHT